MDKEEGLFDRGGFGEDERLIRYLSVSKLLSLLATRSLYLSRIDRFPDVLEGRFTLRDKAYLQNPESGAAFENWEDYRRLVYASCWAVHERESDAQWRRYQDCVAIVTRAGSLESALRAWNPGWSAATYSLGRVRYVNPTEAVANEQHEDGRRKSLLRFATLKDASFRWEEEARIAVFPRTGDLDAEGIGVPVSPEWLVEQIIVGPDCEPCLLHALTVHTEHYGLSDRVTRSEIAELRSAWK